MSSEEFPTRPESAPVVTIFESYGSGASTVGPRVAELLGVPFTGQAYSSEDLERLEGRERSGLVRILSSVGRGAGAAETAAGVGEDEEYERALEGVRRLRAAAADGVVVVGRNATVILADLPNAIHVKLDGPLEQRLARAAAEAGISRGEAARRQVREDRMRAEMSLRLHNWDPRHNDRFDLVINTGTMSLETAAQLIVANHRLLTAARRRSS